MNRSQYCKGKSPREYDTGQSTKQKHNIKRLFNAVLNRTMDSAPTMPRDRIIFDATARMISVVIKVRPSSETPKLAEYITPVYVFL